MTDHTSRQYDAELENIRTKVLQMGGFVEAQIANAIEGLVNGDQDLIDRVIEGDRQVNEQELALDEACAHIIAKRQPAAGDLRMILTVSKVVTDLERIGDEAKKIAKEARILHSADAGFIPKVDVRHVAQMGIDQLRKALDAFARLDTTAAAEIVRQDKAIDAEFKSIMRQLITFMMEDPRTISRGIDILFVAKATERIGDHAKNMAEHVVYLVHGHDVRHAGLEALDREIAAQRQN